MNDDIKWLIVALFGMALFVGNHFTYNCETKGKVQWFWAHIECKVVQKP